MEPQKLQNKYSNTSGTADSTAMSRATSNTTGSITDRSNISISFLHEKKKKVNNKNKFLAVIRIIKFKVIL